MVAALSEPVNGDDILAQYLYEVSHASSFKVPEASSEHAYSRMLRPDDFES